MLPPTRTGAAGGGGGGGGASGRPPTTPPTTPPGTPPSTPTLRSKFVSILVSGLISAGASVGAAFGLTTSTGFGADAAGGGGAGRGGAAARPPRTRSWNPRLGMTSYAIRGMMTIAATMRLPADGHQYGCPLLVPHLDEGSTISPNMRSSRGTGLTPRSSADEPPDFVAGGTRRGHDDVYTSDYSDRRAADITSRKKTVSTNRRPATRLPIVSLDTDTRKCSACATRRTRHFIGRSSRHKGQDV